MKRPMVTIDGNEAAAYVAHKVSEVIAIYPITPSSAMGEWSDEWSSRGQKNIWGTVPSVMEMQSEGGAAGAVHGALQTGALTTTFTSSQGLLLMVPNMFKIAGELTSTVFHIAARSVATHALSIFGDHSDVMAVRATGFAQLCAFSVQETMDMALIAHAATLEGRVPVMHFFDGFRTSHEVMKVEQLTEDDLRTMITDDLVRKFRSRALSPENPVMRGSAQNPDVFFQARETVNPFYQNFPAIVQKAMDKFGQLTGRQYHLFDYYGAPDAERVIVMMGSGALTAQETAEFLMKQGEKVGVVKIHLYRPFAKEAFLKVLPKTVKSIAVLDRTKEPGSSGEPLYQDVMTTLSEAMNDNAMPLAQFPKVIGGRYGLSSKEFTPAMVKAVFDELKQSKPKNHFTVGIHDDVTMSSLKYDPAFSIEPNDVVRSLFYGLGADGTVGANKNSIKIIGEDTDNYAQGYFVYDSKKSGSVTISHLRFGPREINAPYLVDSANFIACHQISFLEKYDMLKPAVEGATFLLNSPYGANDVWNQLPKRMQQQIIAKKLKFYVIDGYRVAKETGMGGRFNTIMQTCFFAISGILPRDKAIEAIKHSIEKTYGKKGEEIVRMNFNAVDQTLANLFQVDVPKAVSSQIEIAAAVSSKAPEFVRNVTAKIIAGDGDELPVSAMPIDGTFPTDTARWEKRNIAMEIPVWDPNVCIQCNKCALVCPHATIRVKVFDNGDLKNKPETFKAVPYKGKEFPNMMYSIQVAPEDCTGCGICVDVCPAKNKSETRLKAINMMPQAPLRDQERINWDYFLDIPEIDRRQVAMNTVKGSQFLQPLFEFSGACSGCGETPYLKLVSQLFGDRAVIANATGCSSIYGGNLPTTPWAKNKDGRGPAWANSLFEDNAEFGLGFRLSIDKQTGFAREMLMKLATQVGGNLAESILNATQKTESDIIDQRERVMELKKKLGSIRQPEAESLLAVADMLVRKSVWIIGGDGWAYDIGYGGLDHVLASGRNVNILVLDTEVYSNTGGQASKSTNRAAVAKFAASGKRVSKKDLGLMAMSAGHVYVAQVAMGSSDQQTVKAFLEAEAYDGPSLIIAYSHCIAHGINMGQGMRQQKAAVDCGHWPLYRYNPDLVLEGQNPMILDSKAPSLGFKDYAYAETRYKMLTKSDPDVAMQLATLAQDDINKRWHFYEQLAKLDFHTNGKN
ncbi:pyruvate:ferredoxin (flavodoxin) oxidoreductase [bacterium]|nr:pyruvate:ferredoxin (flavodoxin) oxidoreductase [bacterium]